MRLLFIIFYFYLFFRGHAQTTTDFSANPWNAKFVVSDTTLFWESFEKVGNTSGNPFEKYLGNGSLGVKGFIENRIISADSLLSMVQERKEDYLASRSVLKHLNKEEKSIRSVYAAMKYWYPDAIFPPIYFVYGRFNSGGTVSENGIILGVEKMKSLEHLKGLVAHELVHFQQNFLIPEEDFDLLANSLMEGSADFLGELTSGIDVNDFLYYKYGNANFEKLALEFAVSLDFDTNIDWLYGTSGKDDRPNDLGYWMGYLITKAYFEKSSNKIKAVYEILNISNARKFLDKSGFLDAQLEKAKRMSSKEKKSLIKRGLSEN